jgi:predicted HTH domain antitoxin
MEIDSVVCGCHSSLSHLQYLYLANRRAIVNQTDLIDWEINQLVKTKLFPDRQAVLRSALRALFQTQPELRRQLIIRTYTVGEISLGKAAELMGVSHEEMKDILIEGGAKIHLGPKTVDELLQDAANA